MQDLLKAIPWHIRASWGISEINKNKESVEFNVNGSKYQGHVTITSDEKAKDLLKISLGGRTLNCTKKTLCSTLDKEIEK